MRQQPPPPMELDYFPPKGTKYNWNPPVLRRRPWWTNIELSGNRYMILHVSRASDTLLYHGWITFRDLQGKHHFVETTRYAEPKDALLATEVLADKLLTEQNLPPWADEALALGWRPPN